jgi:hypothetical protein
MLKSVAPAEPYRIAVATPMHHGEVKGLQARCVGALERALWKDGGRLTHLDLRGESHIQRARNALVYQFLQTDCTHLLWWDGDIVTRKLQHLARMIVADKPILVAPCPLKGINWERVAKAAAAGVPPALLHKHASHFNIVHLDGEFVSRGTPFRIVRGGTGLMLVKRTVFEQLIASGRVDSYKNRNHIEGMPQGAVVYDFHPSPVVADDLLTEDYGFCHLWTQLGGEVWAAPWVEVGHFGEHLYEGSYADSVLAQFPRAAGRETIDTNPESVDECVSGKCASDQP